MLHATITLTGKQWGDLELAILEVSRLIQDEYTEGHERNESGSYILTVTGEEEEEDEPEEVLSRADRQAWEEDMKDMERIRQEWRDYRNS